MTVLFGACGGAAPSVAPVPSYVTGAVTDDGLHRLIVEVCTRRPTNINDIILYCTNPQLIEVGDVAAFYNVRRGDPWPPPASPSPMPSYLEP